MILSTGISCSCAIISAFSLKLNGLFLPSTLSEVATNMSASEKSA